MPKVQLTVVDYSAYDDNLELQIDGQEDPIVLGPRITRQIYVEEIPAI